MEEKYQKQIEREFRTCVEDTISRIQESDETYRPFHSALLSKEALFWSRFERSFSTSFGQRTIERLAEIAAYSNGARDTTRQKETMVRLDKAFFDAVNLHDEQIRSGDRRNRDWNKALSVVANSVCTGDIRSIRIISDLYWVDKNGIENFISLKTVKPNIDQTMVAKKDSLLLKVYKPKCNVYFGLPYNPYGEEKTKYNHKPPMGIFNFHSDEVVLIGKEMWDTIGGKGCYEEILSIVRQVGEETKTRISDLLE